MSIDAVTLTQMRYALALRETRSFSHAAKLSHVTQSTLSIQIQKMEELLGAQVFDRLRKPIAPTATGEQLLAIFQGIIEATDSIPYVVGDQSSRLAGRLRLGVIPTVSPVITPVLAAHFGHRGPAEAGNLRLTLEEVQTGTLLERLERGELDGAIIADSPRAAWMEATLLYEEEFLVYVDPAHSLAGVDRVTSDDLDPDEAWILKEGHCFGTQALGLCTAVRRERENQKKLSYSAGSFETLIDVVHAAGGFTLLPWLYCRRHGLLKLPQLKSFAPPVPVRQIFYLQRRDCLKKGAHEYIRSLVASSLPAEVRPPGRGGGPGDDPRSRPVPVFSAD